MAPTITMSDETFSMLQALAKPFVDTPESVISALAEAELGRRGRTSNGNAHAEIQPESILKLSPDAPDNLAHTRILSAKVDGRPLHRPKWNGMLDYLHTLGRERLGTFEALRHASGANLREGRYEENGYRYVPDADLSIQGVDANLAWDHSLRLARELEIPIQLKIEWRDKEDAAHPGREAILEWTPNGR